MVPSKLYGCAAVILLASVSTAMAAATQVNITDPKNTGRAARVEIGNRLAVQQVPPASFVHSGGNLTSAGACVTFATAPANKAVIVRQVRVDVTNVGVTGGNNNIVLFFGSVCNDIVGQVTPSSVGPLTVTFDPGLVLNPGEALAATAFGSPRAALAADGYTVDPSVVATAGVAP